MSTLNTFRTVGDTGPDLAFRLEADGAAQSLAGATVVAHFAGGHSVELDIDPDVPGRATTPLTPEIVKAGKWAVACKVTFADGVVRWWPNDRARPTVTVLRPINEPEEG